MTMNIYKKQWSHQSSIKNISPWNHMILLYFVAKKCAYRDFGHHNFSVHRHPNFKGILCNSQGMCKKYHISPYCSEPLL